MESETIFMWGRTLDEDFSRISRSIASRLAGSRFLITGATGLIGSLLIKYLLYIHKVHGLDVNVVGVVRSREKAQAIFGEHTALIEWVVADLARDEIEYEGPIDYVVHGAAVTASKAMVSKPVDVINLSINGTRAALDLARQKNAVLLYLSSMEVFGTVEGEGPVYEDMLGNIDILAPRSCYPESKRLCENLCVAYGVQYGADARIARLAQTFGAGVLPGENRAVVAFCRAASEGKPLVLRTRGCSEANYVYGSDAVSALLTILLDGSRMEAYTVANEACHTTIAEMADLAVRTVGISGARVVLDVDEGNSDGFAADVKLNLSAKKLRSLGWKPTVSLSVAMTRLVAYWDERG